MKLVVTLVLFLITSNSYAATAIVEWDNPTQREDGTTLPLSEIAYTKVMWGTCTSTGGLGTVAATVNVPSPNAAVEIQNIPAGSYCFAAVTVDTEGQESVLSNVASKTFNKSRPKGPRIKGIS
jgi:hypothetical protein